MSNTTVKAIWIAAAFAATLVALKISALGDANAAAGALASVFLFVLAALAYLLPTIIANRRGHVNENTIAMLNLFLGWTVIGWIIAFLWSFSAGPRA